MKYIATLMLFLAGCMDNEQIERHRECLSVCNVTENACNEFDMDECTSYCSSLSSMEEVEAFAACANCYVAVYCDADTYVYVCYPDCGGGL